MSLHDIIREDAFRVFANVNDFGETVTYIPLHGSARQITVVIDRQQVATMAEDSDALTPVFEIHVANDPIKGIASDKLDVGVDKLVFASRVGGELKARAIYRLLGHDEGMLVLECR